MKGHSERVPGKNFKSFAGAPLFRWILDSLLDLPEISQVVINTDATGELEAKGIQDSQSDRILLRDRPAAICGDHVSMNRVIENDVEAVPADLYLMTHTTNPLLSSQTIRAALESFWQAHEARDCDSLFTVNRFQTRFYRQDMSPVNHDPQNLVRTQDLEPWYEENSNLYIFTRESFAKTQARIGAQPRMFETPKWESVDIDDQADWDMAEILAQAMLANPSPQGGRS